VRGASVLERPELIDSPAGAEAEAAQ